MASQHELRKWILKNQDILDLEVRELTWIRSCYPGMLDLDVSISIDGREFKGRGSDQNEDVALGKAVCEAIERFMCWERKISSTGVAGHFDECAARENARLEYVERASLSFHFKNRTSLLQVAKKEISINVLGRNQSAQFHTFQISSPLDHVIRLCLVEGVNYAFRFGGILGLGCAKTESAALQKAELECMRSVSALSDFEISPISQLEFREIEKPSSEQRKRLLFNADYCGNLMTWLFEGSGKLLPMESPEYFYSELRSSNRILKDCPLRFFKCEAEQEANFSLEFVG